MQEQNLNFQVHICFSNDHIPFYALQLTIFFDTFGSDLAPYLFTSFGHREVTNIWSQLINFSGKYGGGRGSISTLKLSRTTYSERCINKAVVGGS